MSGFKDLLTEGKKSVPRLIEVGKSFDSTNTGEFDSVKVTPTNIWIVTTLSGGQAWLEYKLELTTAGKTKKITEKNSIDSFIKNYF